MNSHVRTVLFWLLMIALAVVLWRMASTGGPVTHEDQPSYTNFLSKVESGNVKSEIVRVAREHKADLIILGSRERHGLSILVNLTEDTVLHAAPCDVLAMRATRS